MSRVIYAEEEEKQNRDGEASPQAPARRCMQEMKASGNGEICDSVTARVWGRRGQELSISS